MKMQRILFLLLGAAGLFLIYLFQDYLDFYSVIFRWQAPSYLHYTSAYQQVEVLPFVINKACRYVINDLCSIALIYGIFYERKYVRFAFYVMMFGLLILLPAYLALYFWQPPGFSSMLSHLHRLVMNPVLMMLLIPAFFYQRRIQTSRS